MIVNPNIQMTGSGRPVISSSYPVNSQQNMRYWLIDYEFLYFKLFAFVNIFLKLTYSNFLNTFS